MQPHWVGFGALFGWFLFPPELYGLIAGFITHSSTNTNDPTSWFQLLAALGYPLAMLVYGACAYWTIHSTRSLRNGQAVMAMAVFISTLASIPFAVMAMSIDQHENFFHVLFFYPPALVLHVFILINLFISALFGWLIAAGLIKLGRHSDMPVTV